MSIVAFGLVCFFPILATSQPLQTTVPFVQGSICDGADQVVRYTNQSSISMYIRKMQIWFGMDAGGRGDFWAQVTQTNAVSQTYLGGSNWDHYADPTGHHILQYDYTPYYVLVAPGDQLVLEYGCATIPGTPSHSGGVAVYLWWTNTP